MIILNENSRFSDNIRFLRSKHKLTQEKLGAISGVSRSTARLWEVSGKLPKQVALKRLSEYFDICTDDLMCSYLRSGVRTRSAGVATNVNVASVLQCVQNRLITIDKKMMEICELKNEIKQLLLSVSWQK